MTDFQATSDGQKIGKGIKKFGDMVAGAGKLGHALAASVSVHATLHGDTTLADRLIKACDEIVRKSPMKIWLIKNGPFVWSTEEKRFTLSTEKQATLKAEIAKDGEAAVLKRLCDIKDAWQAEPEKDFQGFDVLALLQKIKKKGTKIADDSETMTKYADKIDVRGMDVIDRAIQEIVEQRKATVN